MYHGAVVPNSVQSKLLIGVYMSQDSNPSIRPRFSVAEARMLLHIIRSAVLSPDAIEEAMFRERIEKSLIQFLAVNGSFEDGRSSKNEIPDFEALEKQLEEFDRELKRARGEK